MDTETWGPAAWMFIHSAALAYPESDPDTETVENFKKFFESLVSVLPCVYCRKHYTENLKSLPVTDALESRASLFRWTVDLHNLVNMSLNKPTLDYVEALTQLKKKFRENYVRRQQRMSVSRTHMVCIGVCLLVLFIALGVYLKCQGLGVIKKYLSLYSHIQ